MLLKQKERKGGLLGMLFGTFGAYLLENCYQVHKQLKVPSVLMIVQENCIKTSS